MRDDTGRNGGRGLAIVTIDPDAPAETYVRQHMRLIAPGRTVAVGLGARGRPQLAVPFLAVVATRSRLRSLVNRLVAGYSGAVTGRQARRLADFFAAHDVGAVFAEFGPTGCAMRRFCVQRGLPLFVNFHGFDATVMPRRASVRRAYRQLARDADGIVCGSLHFKAKLVALGFPAERVHVVPCGVEGDTFTRSPSCAIPGRIVAVGRLTPKKAPHLTLAAFAAARERLGDLTLEIVGGGPLEEEIRRTVAERGLGDCVTVHGTRDHAFVKDALARACLFVQHSVTAPNGDEESQGISLLEAMASGLPVVTTRHNGFPETVVEGETGLLCAEGDAAGMAEAIVSLMADPARAAAFGAAGRERAARYEAAALAARLNQLVFAPAGR